MAFCCEVLLKIFWCDHVIACSQRGSDHLITINRYGTVSNAIRLVRGYRDVPLNLRCRRRWSLAGKAALVRRTYEPGMRVPLVARGEGVAASSLNNGLEAFIRKAAVGRKQAQRNEELSDCNWVFSRVLRGLVPNIMEKRRCNFKLQRPFGRRFTGKSVLPVFLQHLDHTRKVLSAMPRNAVRGVNRAGHAAQRGAGFHGSGVFLR